MTGANPSVPFHLRNHKFFNCQVQVHDIIYSTYTSVDTCLRVLCDDQKLEHDENSCGTKEDRSMKKGEKTCACV